MSNYEIRRKGHQITEEMKKDVYDVYKQSLDNKEYKHRAEFMKHKLEELYG